MPDKSTLRRKVESETYARRQSAGSVVRTVRGKYAILRMGDPKRDEFVNVGVIVFDRFGKRVCSRIGGLQRARALRQARSGEEADANFPKDMLYLVREYLSLKTVHDLEGLMRPQAQMYFRPPEGFEYRVRHDEPETVTRETLRAQCERLWLDYVADWNGEIDYRNN